MSYVEALRVVVDWNRNLLYDHPLSDITAYVRDIQWSIGFSEPFQLVAPPATMQITLRNESGAFNVGRPDALFADLLKPDVLVRVSVTIGSTTTYLVTLKTAGVALSPNGVGAPTAVLTCVDWHNDMMNTVYDPKPVPVEWWDLGYFRTDRIIGDAFSLNGALPMYPSANAWWIMGASEMGVNTITSRYEGPGYYVHTYGGGVHVGEIRILYYGNNTDAQGQGTSLLAFIEDICAAEMDGRFKYVTDPADGRPVYWYMPRNELAERFSSSAVRTVFSTECFDAQYVVGANQCNQMEITMYPRAIGSAGSELARTGNAFKLRAGEQREMTLRYRNPLNPNESCAATTIITPVASTDYTANAADDGSGTNLTANLNLFVENKTNSARCVLTNAGAVDLYVTLLKIRGTPLTAGSPIKVTSIDAPSVKDHGLFRQARTIAGLDNVEMVQRYADWQVQRFANPRTEFRAVSFYFDERTSADLRYFALNAQGIGAHALRIVDGWVEQGVTPKPYLVAGMNHMLSGGQWTVTLLLEECSAVTGIWKMGDADLSVIGETARLGF